MIYNVIVRIRVEVELLPHLQLLGGSLLTQLGEMR